MAASDEAPFAHEASDIALLRAHVAEISRDRDSAWSLLKALQADYAKLESRSGMPICTPREYETLVKELSDTRADLTAARDAADSSQVILSEVQARLTASQAMLFDAQLERATLSRPAFQRDAEPETSVPELAELRIELAEANARIAAFDTIRDRLYDTYLRCAGERDEARAALAVAATRAQETSRELARAKDDALRAKIAIANLHDHVAALETTRERNGSLVRSLAEAQAVSASTISSLEKTRLQLEFELATRVESAQARAARHERAFKDVSLERAMLIEALRLREERVAVLEATVRRIARETIAATEAELERYRAMHQSLIASKLFSLRRFLAAVMVARTGVRSVLRRKVRAKPANPARPADRPARPRHLRSA